MPTTLGIIKYSSTYLIVGIDKEMCGFSKTFMWINSSVIVSAKKTGNTSTGTTLSMLKIYSRCLMCILKVKYTEFKFSYFTTVLSD